jgi:hypothetical protein
MRDHSIDPARPEAWGDVIMPAAADLRRSSEDRQPAQAPGDEGRPASAVDPDPLLDPTLRQDTNEYAFGATTLQPAVAPGLASLPLGPGNEAMEDGASPAPRSYTGGAMGKYIAGLSPSFSAAAAGEPPPGGPEIYTPAEAAATFTGAAAHRAGLSPERTPQETIDAPAGPESPGPA